MTKDRAILLFGLVTYGMGQSLLYVIFGPLARDLGLAEWQFGVLISASNITVVAMSPMWGRVSQSRGRKNVFIFGLLGYAVGYSGLAFGIQIGLWGWLAPIPLFMLLFGARIVYGAMASAISPSATAYIADTTDATNRSAGMALIAASGGIGTIIGPAFGGVLAKIGPVVPMYTASALAVVAAIWAALQLVEPNKHADMGAGVKLKITDMRVFPYLLGWFVIFMVFTAVQVITAFYIEDRFGITNREDVITVASIALLSMALVTLTVQVGVMQIWKLSPKVLLRTAYFIFAGVLLLFAYSQTLLMMYIAYGGMGMSFALAAPGLNAAGSLAVEANEQGAVAGLLSAAPAFGMVFGPALGGLVYNLAPTLPMIGGAVLSVLVGLYFLTVRIPDPQSGQPGTPAD